MIGFTPIDDEGEALGERSLSGKQIILLRRLKTKYTENMIRTILQPLITKTAPVSLRSLDWAVVNYSKTNNSIVCSQTPGVYVTVHRAYQEYLRYWKRRLFDPFRRKHPLKITIGGEEVVSTFGQANFVLFVIETGIIGFVIRNIADIEESMNLAVQRQRAERARAEEDGRKRSRSELTKSSSPPLVLYKSTSRVTL